LEVIPKSVTTAPTAAPVRISIGELSLVGFRHNDHRTLIQTFQTELTRRLESGSMSKESSDALHIREVPACTPRALAKSAAAEVARRLQR
jgi:hypothetical protein